MDKSESIANLAAALNLAQSEMGCAVKDANNPFYKSKYADLSSVVSAIKDSFSKNGLSYSQFPISEDGRVGVETILMHSSGEWLSQKFTVPLSKNDAQGAGSCITYCRRYGLQAVAGIPADDDDGNAASIRQEEKKSPAQKKAAAAISDLDRQWIYAIRLDPLVKEQLKEAPDYLAHIEKLMEQQQ